MRSESQGLVGDAGAAILDLVPVVCCTLRLCHCFKGGTLPTLLPHSPCRDFTPIIFWGTESRQSSVAASVLNSH